MRILLSVLGLGFAVAGLSATEQDPRVRSGLVVLYDFASTEGEVVRDRSEAGRAVDLEIKHPEAVVRREGSLELVTPTMVRSRGRAARLGDSIRLSGEVTVEVWMEPAESGQKGRFIGMAPSNGQRNFGFSQDGDRFDLTFRTTRTGTSGGEPLSVEHKANGLTHFVYTRDRTGRTRVFFDGKLVKELFTPGSLDGFEQFPFSLGDELSADDPWLGTYHLVAVYNRDLLAREVARNFEAGPGYRAPVKVTAGESTEGDLFQTVVAPLLASKCLECHNASSKSGGLDLSTADTAFAGKGEAIIIAPGDPDVSRLIAMVEEEKMPLGRPPLLKDEKKRLREWVQSGAEWTVAKLERSTEAPVKSPTGQWVRRLTIPEYAATIRSVLGVDVTADAAELLPPDSRADGFKNTAYNLNVDFEHVAAYARLAERIVNKMDIVEFASRFSDERGLSDEEIEPLIGAIGAQVLRSPLEEEELTMYRGLARAVADAGGNFEEVIGYVVESMVQSPRLLYRVENQRGDGSAWPAGEYELASRLSYIIWGSAPDGELMRAADAGTLHDPAVFEAQADRMLNDDRAVEWSAQFLSEWLDLDRLANLQPNKEKFPGWDPKLASDMRDESLHFFKEVVWKQERPLADLLNAKVTYATPGLAKHYGMTPQEGGLQRYDLSETPSRGGLLTHGSVLTIGGDEASMVTRGLFVLKELLYDEVGNPPPGLDTTPPPTRPGRSHRANALDRVNSPSCGGCHARFEPLAFGLEKFDGLGTHHDVDEHGNELREDGEVLFPGTSEPVQYKTTGELMNLLAGSDRVAQALTRKVTQFALGRPLTQEDEPAIESIHEAAKKGGGTYRSLVAAIVKSDLVQMTPTEPLM